MSITISQLRPAGLAAAVEFAKGLGLESDPKKVDTDVSLVAREDETIVAVILGIRHDISSVDLEVCLGELEDSAGTTRKLIDKSFMKFKAVGIRRCQIHYHGKEAVSKDWPNAKWTAGQEDEVNDSIETNATKQPPTPQGQSPTTSEPGKEAAVKVNTAPDAA